MSKGGSSAGERARKVSREPKRITYPVISLAGESVVLGVRLHRYFGAHEAGDEWHVTHLPTKRNVPACLWTCDHARRFVSVIIRKYGAKAFQSEDAKTVVASLGGPQTQYDFDAISRRLGKSMSKPR